MRNTEFSGWLSDAAGRLVIEFLFIARQLSLRRAMPLPMVKVFTLIPTSVPALFEWVDSDSA